MLTADADVLARLSDGDPQAWEGVARQCGGRLIGCARRLVHTEEAARDAVRAAFVAASKSIAGCPAGSNLAAWLHLLTVAECVRRLGSTSQQSGAAIEPLLPQFLTTGAHADPVEPWPISAPAQLPAAAAQVRSCIDGLPLDYRVVLLLMDVEGLDATDVAAILGLEPAAVRFRLHRARMALRTLLAGRLTSTSHAGRSEAGRLWTAHD